jgi:(2S)-methylsuccinyl-CoA dehydrogenase
VQAAEAAGQFVSAGRQALLARVAVGGKISSRLIDVEQRAVHGFAWMATVAATLRAASSWAVRLESAGSLTSVDVLALKVGFGEYVAQLAGGIPMSQNEIVRPSCLGIEEAARDLLADPAVAELVRSGNSAANREALVGLLREGQLPGEASGDQTLDMIRDQFRRFTDQRILPNAHRWHLENALIPDDVIAEMAELGVFGVSIETEFGGLELGKVAMCIVTEELSRGWITAGSLGTRSEIAGELISLAGTDEQKRSWLPRIAGGEVLPTAVFTEPDTGSDLGNLTTRVTFDDNGDFCVRGSKTWITHASRSDLMTMLVRTKPDVQGYAGLSMLLVPKPRGTEADPFPAAGMSGTEIEVLGYRGMREYVLAFDDLRVSRDAVLGGREGQGFKQLMRTFESARIQTAARAIGVARRAFELGLAYAFERKQFGRPIGEFPRVGDKLAMMVAENLLSRELTHFAAREKDKGRRCDVEAGMAKLLAARVAWSNADTSLQIHGGNGYSLEYEISRILCDARILNIFEGAGEIQAQVVAKGILGQQN